MIKEKKNQFNPDYAVPPGDILLEYLENIGMTQVELADRMGMPLINVNEIIKGKAPITPKTALKLEKIFGRPAHFWNNLERYFQEHRGKVEARNE